MIHLNRQELDPFLWDVYIKDVNNPELTNHIFLLFDFTKVNQADFEKYLGEKLRKHKYYAGSYFPEEEKLIFIFSCPPYFREVYLTLLDSKYSRVSHDYKWHLLNYHGKNNDSNLFNVIWRTEKRRKKLEAELSITLEPDAELSEYLHMERETFNVKCSQTKTT